jgi:hypothetical protein
VETPRIANINIAAHGDDVIEALTRLADVEDALRCLYGQIEAFFPIACTTKGLIVPGARPALCASKK